MGKNRISASYRRQAAKANRELELVHKANVAAGHIPPRLAKKPQEFDCSPLPLFGDAHKQKELF
jgi:hypothetical protein